MDKPLIPQYLMNYIDSLVPPCLPEMQAMEADAEEMGFPIVGPASGYLCYKVARMIGANPERECQGLRLDLQRYQQRRLYRLAPGYRRGTSSRRYAHRG